jgi:hypothetical protein
MYRIGRASLTLFLLAATAGCVTTVPAPGATDVKFTSNPNDVANCTAVGNIGIELMHGGVPLMAQNRAVGLGGNVIFDSGTGGIAYRCPAKSN